MAESEDAAVQFTGLYLIHDTTFDAQALLDRFPDTALTTVSWSERDTAPPGARVLLCLGDEHIRDITTMAAENRWEVGLLPHPEASQAMAALGVKGNTASLYAHYLQVPPIEADVLTCNGEVVFSSVVIGRVLALRPYDINRPPSNWSMFTGALKELGTMSLKPYKIVTGKDREIQLAAIGLAALRHTQSSLLGRKFAENLTIGDGQFSLLALAPRSIFSFLWFIAHLLWPKKFTMSLLPKSLGLIQSDRLQLESPEGLDYLIDGKPVHATQIELMMADQSLLLLPGPALVARQEETKPSDKETVRLNHIPINDGARPLVENALPLFDHAGEEEYRELFVSLRNNATATSSYQVLMVLSVLLALTGLYANSAPVIIGAMILAPLMSPIVTLAMGLARTEANLIRGSLQTLVIGVAWGLACAILLAWIMPLDVPTQEMKARMSPTLLDLLVAVISGAAGAYAHAKEEIAKSLAGVAIAVALVPPLGVAGIGVGWADWDMAWGAFLLLTTNLVGIALAGSLMFLVLGFAPFNRARKGVGISLLIMLVISAPLYVSFARMVQKDRILEQITQQLPTGEVELAGMRVSVDSLKVTVGEPHLVKVVLSSSKRMDINHVDALKKIITKKIDQPIVLEAQLNLRR